MKRPMLDPAWTAAKGYAHAAALAAALAAADAKKEPK